MQGVSNMVPQFTYDHYRAFDDLPEGFFCSTPEGRYLYANNTLARMLGYESRDLLIQEVLDIKTELYVDPPQRDELLKQLDANNIVKNFYVHLKRKDNTTFWALLNCRAIKNDQNKILWIESTIIDVDDSKLTLETLRVINDLVINFTMDATSNIKKAIQVLKELSKADVCLYYKHKGPNLVLYQAVGEKHNIPPQVPRDYILFSLSSTKTPEVIYDVDSTEYFKGSPFKIALAQKVLCRSKSVGLIVLLFKYNFKVNEYLRKLVTTICILISNEETRESVLTRLKKLASVNVFKAKELSVAIDMVEEPLVFLNKKGLVIDANRAFCQLVRLNSNSIHNRSYKDFHSEEVSRFIESILEENRRSEGGLTKEATIMGVPYEVKMAYVGYGDDEECHIICFKRSIREYLGEPSQEAPKRTDSPKILLVEDNHTNMVLAKKILEKIGYTNLDTAYDGWEALELAKKETYQIILMDCDMPRMDGFEATRRIRTQAGPNQKVPIVAVTAFATEAERQKAFESGMDDYITKPISKEILEAVLRKWTQSPKTFHLPGQEQRILLSKRTLHDENLAQELLELYEKESKIRLGKIRELLSFGDLNTITKLLTECYAMAITVGISEESQLFLQMVGAAKAGNREEIMEKMKKFL